MRSAAFHSFLQLTVASQSQMELPLPSSLFVQGSLCFYSCRLYLPDLSSFTRISLDSFPQGGPLPTAGLTQLLALVE